MYTTEPQSVFAAHGNAEVIVKTTDELDAAIANLSTSGGGTIYLAPSDTTYGIDVRNMKLGEDNAIRITSLEPDNEATVHTIFARDISHFSFDGFKVNSGSLGDARSTWKPDVLVTASNNVAITDLELRGNATELFDSSGSVLRGEDGIRVESSDNILIANNDISNLFHGIALLGVTNTAVIDNEISAMQGDGIRGGGVQDTLIANNHVHDFLGSTNEINHPDFIQLWVVWPVGVTNSDVTISGNFLDAGDGVAAQGIFINNEAYAMPGNVLEGVLGKNIVITDNVVHTGIHNGISVSRYDGVEIHDNTVLWAESATLRETDSSDPISVKPAIVVGGGTNSHVSGNIASSIAVQGKPFLGDNYVLDYQDASAPNYAYDHFVGLSAFRVEDPRDLLLRPDSPLNESFGSSQSDWTPSALPIDPVVTTSGVSQDRAALEFSAEYSTVDGALVDPDSARFIWTFEDGDVREGVTVTRSFPDADGPMNVALDIVLPDGRSASQQSLFEAGTYDIVSLDFSNLQAELGDMPHNLVNASENLNGTLGLNARSAFKVSPAKESTVNLDTLNLSLDYRPDSFAAGDPWLVFWNNAVQLRVTDEQGLTALVKTDEGFTTLRSPDGVLQKGQWSNISLNFDGPDNSLSLSVDDTVVSSAPISGTINASTHPLALGNPFSVGRSATGEVGALEVTAPASVRFTEVGTASEAQDAPQFDVLPDEQTLQQQEQQDQQQNGQQDQQQEPVQAPVQAASVQAPVQAPPAQIVQPVVAPPAPPQQDAQQQEQDAQPEPAPVARAVAPEQIQEQNQQQTPEQVQEQAQNQAPEQLQFPEQAPEQTPEQIPELVSEQAPPQASPQFPAQFPQQPAIAARDFTPESITGDVLSDILDSTAGKAPVIVVINGPGAFDRAARDNDEADDDDSLAAMVQSPFAFMMQMILQMFFGSPDGDPANAPEVQTFTLEDDTSDSTLTLLTRAGFERNDLALQDFQDQLDEEQAEEAQLALV